MCKNLCTKHYYRLKRRGTVELPSTESRFWEKVDKASTDCWIWKGNGAKYGSVTVNRRTVLAHRLSWTMQYGPIPEGLIVCHTCDVPRCVNPDHLFLGSHKENTQDMVQKGRSAKGKDHGNSKLTEEKVVVMRQKFQAGVPEDVLAEEYGVSRRQISNIIKRRQWKHV